MSQESGYFTRIYKSKPDSLEHRMEVYFFDRKVLDRYRKKSSCKLEFKGSMGLIRCAMWQLSFGLNDKGRLHAHLKDLHEIPPKEQGHWAEYIIEK